MHVSGAVGRGGRASADVTAVYVFPEIEDVLISAVGFRPDSFAPCMFCTAFDLTSFRKVDKASGGEGGEGGGVGGGSGVRTVAVVTSTTITTTTAAGGNTPLIELQPSSWMSEDIRKLGTSLDVDDLRRVELVGREGGKGEGERERGIVVMVVDGKGKFEFLRLFPDGRKGGVEGDEKEERRLELVEREELPRHCCPVVFFHCLEVGMNCLVFEDGLLVVGVFLFFVLFCFALLYLFFFFF